jgi:hypothetical protein
MWTLIPQLFYDFLARIVPGAVLIVVTAFVVSTPASNIDLLLTSHFGDKTVAFTRLLWGGLGAYLIGFLLSQMWLTMMPRRLKDRLTNVEAECKQDRLAEHNRVLVALGYPSENIQPEDLPQAFVMREQLRLVVPNEALRLLKVRAERRICQILMIGLSILFLVNLVYFTFDFGTDRILLELIFVVAVFLCWKREHRLHEHFVNGTTVLWLIHASSRRLPILR